MALARDALRAADALVALELPNDAVSRAYYATLHAARALLMTHGLEPKTHQGVVALLNGRFASTVGEDAVSAFARLQTFRGIADYASRPSVSLDRARLEVTAAHAFVDAIEMILTGRAGTS